ncbi:MAG: acetolactate synthase small subunit [Kofleriaceae bacterium]
MTLTVDGALHPIDQVTKQLHKLINVLKIRDLEPDDTVTRELALFKISVEARSARRSCRSARSSAARSSMSRRSVIVEITGTTDKVEGFERMVRPFGLIEMMRTGEIAISRGRRNDRSGGRPHVVD